ncbi:hypothetical protein [Inediibacterium massiliense]|uniref:hypothetical protein n=1 Tax=Inediibacterium massiliense TaxID=1658111 RepID=UPI0006B47DA1|nr:hypothetical protein [Inediibacterium massiliense]
MIFWEIKKLFKSKIGWISLGLFVFLCGVSVFLKPVLETENIYRNEKYELIKDTRSKEIIAQEKLDQKMNQIKEMASYNGDDDFSQNLKIISKKKLKAIENTKYQDVSFFKVFNHRITHPFINSVMMIILVLIFSNIYTDERVSGMNDIILSSKNKFKVLYSKLEMSIFLPIILYIAYISVTFIITIFQYGPPVHGQLQAFRIIDFAGLLKEPYTIYEYLILKMGVMILIFTTISVFASFFSFATTTSLAAISGSVLFIGAGKVVTVMKFLPYSLVMIMSTSNYIDIMFHMEQFVGMYLGHVHILGINVEIVYMCNIFLVSMLGIGIGSCIFTFKKVLTK